MAETENLSAGETPPDAEQIAAQAIADWYDQRLGGGSEPVGAERNMAREIVAALREAGYLTTPGAARLSDEELARYAEAVASQPKETPDEHD